MSNYYTLSSMYKAPDQKSVKQQSTTSINAPVLEQKNILKTTKITELNLENPNINQVAGVSPNVWGRALWFSLHFGALNYPLKPTEEMKEMEKSFINGLPIMIPCDKCKNHSLQFLIDNKKEIEIAVQNPENLFAFFVKFHNSVNARLGKRIFSVEEAKVFWKNTPTQIFNKENFRV
jgi:hypothetical protein